MDALRAKKCRFVTKPQSESWDDKGAGPNLEKESRVRGMDGGGAGHSVVASLGNKCGDHPCLHSDNLVEVPVLCSSRLAGVVPFLEGGQMSGGDVVLDGAVVREPNDSVFQFGSVSSTPRRHIKPKRRGSGFSRCMDVGSRGGANDSVESLEGGSKELNSKRKVVCADVTMEEVAVGSKRMCHGSDGCEGDDHGDRGFSVAGVGNSQPREYK